VYWLRRIPAETRIVVLVVFLALFQSVLLSVFGLVAIGHERRQVEEQVRSDAERFLRTDLVPRCQYDLRDLADVAFAIGFDPEGGRLEKETRLFLEAYRVGADGRIVEPGGDPLYLGREAALADDAVAQREAADLASRYTGHEVGDDEKAALDLAFARRHPFCRDEFGESLALLFAATALTSGGPVSPHLLLEMRWVGVLNRVAGHLAAAEVERFLARIDREGAGGPVYREGVREQEAREAKLVALVREAPRLPRDGKPRLQGEFYVRPGGTEEELSVLAVAPQRLSDYLAAVVEAAKGSAREGVEARIVAAADAPALGISVPMDLLPGHVAVARISSASVRQQAADRERFYRYIIAFSVAGILAGGFLTVRAVTREVKLAKLKSGFVGNVTHELKTPLTSIRMFVEMLSGGKVTDEAEREECLSVIAQETDRLGRLIQQVLDFGRLDAHRRRFAWTTGPLGPVVLREAERFRRTTGLDAERFRVEIGGEVPAAVHDPEAFAEVVSNLLSNAWKYTPRDDKRIALRLLASGGRVVLAVEDNGPGIAPKERERIFEQFYRIGDLVTREVEGTGLGLAIARSIVRAHGGRIRVEDAPGGGSRFLVVLPSAAPAKPAEGAVG